MKRWALILNKTVVLVTEQETKPQIDGLWIECQDNIGPNCKYIDGQFYPPDPDPVILSRLQMIDALGNSYVSIVSTSKTDDEVEVWLEKFRLTETFNLSSADVINKINFLVTKNLITQEKANTILNQ